MLPSIGVCTGKQLITYNVVAATGEGLLVAFVFVRLSEFVDVSLTLLKMKIVKFIPFNFHMFPRILTEIYTAN